MPRILIIGYGNPLRGDDAAGVVMGEKLEDRYAENGEIEVVVAHQLLPEHVAQMAEAEYVLFLDASVEGEPGRLQKQDVIPTDETKSPLTHALTPEQLLGMTQRLFDSQPQAILWTLTGWEFGHQEGMTEEMVKAVSSWFEQVTHYIDAIDAVA